MNKLFLPIALLPLTVSSVNPVFAESMYKENGITTNTIVISQIPNEFLIAGFGDFIGDVKKVVEDGTDAVREVDDTINDMEDREIKQREREQALQERQAREEERKKRQEELAAARKAATERQIQEAERRRQYFDSLSPEEKQAYIDQQQAARQKQAEANLLMLGLFADFLIGGSSSGSSSDSQPEYTYIPNNSPRPTNNPAPPPVKPIDPFYGCPAGC